MTHLLAYCGNCSLPFTARDLPLPSEPLVFTMCSHIFHQKCLKGWVTTPEGSCPTCRGSIYKRQAGKDFTIYQTVFLEALRHDPDIVLQTLQESQHTNGTCTARCQEDLPLTLLRFDTQSNRLVHTDCSPPEMPALLMQDIATIVKKIVTARPQLQPNFTPTPPAFYQRIEYPILSGVLLIESASLAALALNHSGTNKTLLALGLPAQATIRVAQYLGFLAPPAN